MAQLPVKGVQALSGGKPGRSSRGQTRVRPSRKPGYPRGGRSGPSAAGRDRDERERGRPSHRDQPWPGQGHPGHCETGQGRPGRGAVCRALAGGLDRVIGKDDRDLRGTPPGETASLLRSGMVAAAPGMRVETALDGEGAVCRVLEQASTGDLVVILLREALPYQGQLEPPPGLAATAGGRGGRGRKSLASLERYFPRRVTLWPVRDVPQEMGRCGWSRANCRV